MDWMNTLGEIVQRYSSQGGGTGPVAADPHGDFLRVAQNAPNDAVAGGIAQAFRSDRTPPFPQMVAGLFGQSDPNQRAGLLNRLLGSVAPEGLGSIPAVGDLLGMLGRGGVTPEQASQVSPDQVQQIAAHAERQNPSIVDEVSGFYAQHPQVVKAVGGLALTIALQHMLQRR